MKTIKILTLAVVLFFTGISISSAEVDSLAQNVAVEKLTKEFKSLYRGMPYSEVMCGNSECSISICFKVNENGKVEIIHVIGQNDELVKYSEKVFADKEITADKYIFDQEFYWIKMVFQNRSL